MKRFTRIITALLAALLLVPSLALSAAQSIELNAADYPVTEDGLYSSMEEVAVYLHTFGHLPSNFLTKREAEALGWSNRDGNLKKVAPGHSIGGDHFGNYEGNVQAPDGKKHSWTECDIDSDGGYRNGKRIVFSTDGLIFYTDDHYNTFKQVLVTEGEPTPQADAQAVTVTKDGEYTSRDEVAAYLRKYGKLPKNYLTKSEAKALGWNSKRDNLGQVAPGCALGGDTFGNREGLLPAAKGRTWKECDVNVVDGKRGKERIVYSSDGLIYYTSDNHKSFQEMY